MASHTLAPFPEELLAAKKQIRERARSYGLDFFPVIFEMCDYEQMNQIAAYGGFPQRYPHWRFGIGIRSAPQAASLRPGPHLRDGDQQRSLLRLFAGIQRSWSIRSWSSPTSTATAISSRTISGSARPIAK